MISFSVSARRNEDADAWDVRVDAYLDPSEEVTGSPEAEEAISEAWVGEDGVLIGRLEALMLHVWPLHNAEGLLELLEVNDGDGNTWDAHEQVRSTAAALMRWLNTPAGDGLFLESEEPIETILLSRLLEADPFVDRGALLAMMIQHLSALSPNRILLAHEEPPENLLPPDQRGRVRERARAFLSVGERVGFGRFVALPAEPDEGRAGIYRLLNGMADRPLLIGSVLPDGPDYPEWTVWDDLEIELIDLVEWARARLGVELSLAEEETEPAG
jgi:hypothetical protein